MPEEFGLNELLGIPILVGALSVALHFLALRLFPRFNLLDFPERYGITRRRLPYPTGIITLLLFLLAYVVLEQPSILKSGVAFAIVLLGITSFVDDRRTLPASTRLIIQCIIALLLFASGARIYSVMNPLPQLGFDVLNLSQWIVAVPVFGSLPLLSALFTLVWLLLTINALNWFDGIHGQTSMLASLAFLTLGFLSQSSRVGDAHLALLCFILASLAFGAFLFELPPPKVIPGDTGSMFYGLMLGVITLYAGQGKVATAFLVLGLPLIDFAVVIVRRLQKGVSPLRGNTRDEHLHHRLLQKGWSPYKIISLSALLGGAFGITALFLDTGEKFVAAILLAGIVLGLSLYTGTKQSR